MIRILFRYLCARPVGADKDEPPVFVHTEGSMPSAPYPELRVKPDASGNTFIVHEVCWDKHRPDVYTAFLVRRGDAQPLQPSLGVQEMLDAGWVLS